MEVDITDEIEIEDWKPELPFLNYDKNEIQFIQSDKIEQNEQKCHICDRFFENLEAHFAASHIKQENSDDENVINENLECQDFVCVNIK